MRVLHVGYGFIPWRGGGLVEYAESIMSEQAKKGYEVAYFCSGRHYPIYTKTFLKTWRKDGYKIYEVINPLIFHGGDRGTFFDLESMPIEKLFLKVLKEFKPNLIHIHELAGLPSSLIDVIKDNTIPVIMTLQDYFLLCPTLKLFDYAENDCIEMDVGKKCIFCIKSDVQGNKKALIRNTFIYELKKIHLPIKILKGFYKFLKKILLRKKTAIHIENRSNTYDAKISDFFQKRRDTNVKRLQKIDLLIAQSYKVEEIYKFFVKGCKIKTIHLTVRHIEKILPKTIKPKIPLKFGTLNGMASIPKGAYLLYRAIEILNKKGLGNKFELHIFGGMLDEIKEKLNKLNNIFYHGVYHVNDLNKILENIDVGIIPSIWQEAYGYVGIEFLAKGIPIIGNNKGGIVDYTIDGFTGWVNKTSTAEELAEIMEKIINNPMIIQDYNQKILKERKNLIKTIEQHFYELDEIYKKVINKEI